MEYIFKRLYKISSYYVEWAKGEEKWLQAETSWNAICSFARHLKPSYYIHISTIVFNVI